MVRLKDREEFEMWLDDFYFNSLLSPCRWIVLLWKLFNFRSLGKSYVLIILMF
jgi:hypothetical protein